MIMSVMTIVSTKVTSQSNLLRLGWLWLIASTTFAWVYPPVITPPTRFQRISNRPLANLIWKLSSSPLDSFETIHPSNILSFGNTNEEATTTMETLPPTSLILTNDADFVNSLLTEIAEITPLSFQKNDTSWSDETIRTVSEVLSITETAFVAPSTRKILQFALPAIGVWLCGPILSLIDTSSVGILSGTLQQAALTPAVAVTDYSALLIAFLFTGATNLMAAAKMTDQQDTVGQGKAAQAFAGAMRLSTFVGASLGFVLFAFARQLLLAIIGNDDISPAVFDAAIKYVRIRAIGMPAAAIIGSAQAACLGMQDIRSPLYVLLVAAGVNFIGDMIFVPRATPWLGGAAGAAWATVISQFVAVGIFVYWLTQSPKQHVNTNDKPDVNLSQAILELTGSAKSAGKSRRRKFKKFVSGLAVRLSSANATNRQVVDVPESTNDELITARGFLQGKFRARDLVKFPDEETIRAFSPYMIPVTTTQIGRVSGYVAMSHVVSSSLGTVSMAAQQVIVSLFYCLCPVADSLSLTAQSFVPGISQRPKGRNRARALQKTIQNFLKAGGVFGGVMVAAVSCIPLLSHFFTNDPNVIMLVNMVSPLLVGFFAVHGILCASEGLLLGQKDLAFLGKMYGAFFAVVPYMMLRVKQAALVGAPVNLTAVWKVFVGYQITRCTLWVCRILLLQRRTNRDAAEMSP